MNSLTVKITGASKHNNIILIDDKEVKLKKNSFGSYNHLVETEKESVNIKIKSVLEINSKYWFITNIFFFIISIFGIFDYRLPKKCFSISFEETVKLSSEQNEMTIALLNQIAEKPCAQVTSNCEVEEIQNTCVQDAKALKRMKILKRTKFFLWIALIIGAIIAVFMIN